MDTLVDFIKGENPKARALYDSTVQSRLTIEETERSFRLEKLGTKDSLDIWKMAVEGNEDKVAIAALNQASASAKSFSDWTLIVMALTFNIQNHLK